MLRRHVQRRLSDRLDGITHGPEGSVDKLLMTWAEQAVGHAALAIGGIGHDGVGDDTWLNAYLYSRAQSVMGGTSQIQRNLVARRILGLPPVMTRGRGATGGPRDGGNHHSVLGDRCYRHVASEQGRITMEQCRSREPMAHPVRLPRHDGLRHSR